MMNVSDFRTILDRKTGQRDLLQKQMDSKQDDLLNKQSILQRQEEARIIIQTVAQATQKQLEYRVSELVTLAMAAVFPDPYELHLDFELKRGRSEAAVTFSKDGGEKIEPMDASGGGPIEIAAFALRVSLWSLQDPRSRNVIIMDEPFRAVSRDLQHKASDMLKEISNELGLQMIIVTHEPTLAESADRVFEVTQTNRISKVEMIR